MKISLGIGALTVIIGLLSGLISNDWSITVKICRYIGAGCLVLGALFNGAFISGDRHRANYSYETKADRREREKGSNHLLVISVPNIIAAIVIYMVQ